MKKKKSPKTVTLPINNYDIFNSLAEIAWSVEEDKKKLSHNKEKFFHHIRQELGKDAFCRSFTPSGEIGSGETMENPQTPRISKYFYDGLGTLFDAKSGSMSVIMRKHTNSERVEKNRMFRFKSSIVNLVQVYLETQMGLITNDRPKEDRKTKRKRVTSFNYEKRPDGLSDEQWYDYLIKVEMNRYLRMFVATIFFVTIADLFSIDMESMAKTIDSNDLANVNDIDASTMTNVKKLHKKFSRLKSPKNRQDFVENVKKMWKLKLTKPTVGKKKTGAQVQLSLLGEEEEEA